MTEVTKVARNGFGLPSSSAESPLIGESKLRLYAAAIISVLFVIMAVLGPYIYDFDPVATNLRGRLLPPGSRLPTGELTRPPDRHSRRRNYCAT